MTWSTAGISRPRAAISVARRTELGVDLNLDGACKREGAEDLGKVKQTLTCQDSLGAGAVLVGNVMGMP
jgi:hypothetical protein